MDFFFEKLSLYGVDLPTTMERFVDDENLYKNCFKMLFADENWEMLVSAVTNKEYDMLFDITHSLKGIVGNLGLTPLYNSICCFVESLRKNDFSNLDKQYKAVMDEYHSVEALKAFI